MTSHLLAWNREFDLSENGDLFVPVCSEVLDHSHMVASGGCGSRQGRLGLVVFILGPLVYTWLL